MTSPSSLRIEVGSQPYSELGPAPDVGEGCGNHQMSCIVLSGLETHNLSGPEMGHSQEWWAIHGRCCRLNRNRTGSGIF